MRQRPHCPKQRPQRSLLCLQLCRQTTLCFHGLLLCLFLAAAPPCRAFVPPTTATTTTTSRSSTTPNTILRVPFSSVVAGPTVRATAAQEDDNQEPQTFRQAEIMGLQFMREGDYEQALKAFQWSLELPGSRADVVRTKLVSGPSPVGGSAGGTESSLQLSLDEFELQAAHYNAACAQARLNMKNQAVASLEKAFANGFDNTQTVRNDADLQQLKGMLEFEQLMGRYETNNKNKRKQQQSKSGNSNNKFNPFGFFQK